MTDLVSMTAQQGIGLACPVCDAQPGELCRDPATGRGRRTTHQERKPRGEDS